MIYLQNQKYKEWEEEKHDDGWLTFFTPTFNRAYFLLRLYDMLVAQTNNHFVWLLVSDGSTDDTKEIADKLLVRDDFPMMFIYKENGGKHSAFKVALDNTITEYFICMDDDDLYQSDAVETFLSEWRRIEEEGKTDEIGAIRTLAQRKDGSYASNVPVKLGERHDCTTLVRTYVEDVYQENWTCYRTAALKTIELFPEGYWLQEQHSFFLESIWQGRFARKYKCRYYNVSVRQYTDDADVSLMRATKSRKHYQNMFINEKMVLDEQLDYIKRDFRLLLTKVVLVGILRAKLNIKFSDLLKNTNSKLLKMLYCILLPICMISPNPRIN